MSKQCYNSKNKKAAKLARGKQRDGKVRAGQKKAKQQELSESVSHREAHLLHPDFCLSGVQDSQSPYLVGPETPQRWQDLYDNNNYCYCCMYRIIIYVIYNNET